MNKLTGIIIAKNSESLLADCIDSVSFCDEIIVIDDGSTDRTVDLAKHLGATVYSHSFKSFAEKRNYGLRKARSKWMIYIDADERVSQELKKEILDTIEINKNKYAAYKLHRKNFYFGNFEWPYIEKLERLFKKSTFIEWKGEIHETAYVNGEIGELQEFLIHYTHRDLTSMVEKTIEWSKTEAELRFKANHPKMVWWRFFRVMGTAFYDSFIKQKGRTIGTAGLVESIYQAFSIFITYARLWEMQNKK